MGTRYYTAKLGTGASTTPEFRWLAVRDDASAEGKIEGILALDPTDCWSRIGGFHLVDMWDEVPYADVPAEVVDGAAHGRDPARDYRTLRALIHAKLAVYAATPSCRS